MGGKYKLLPQILPLLPNNIHTFIDLFSGGCNVGVNVKADKIICNDILKEVINFCEKALQYDIEYMLTTIDDIINTYSLSKTNKDGYFNLRNDYNRLNKDWSTFYTLVAHSFSNQIRFNKKGEFNMPFGDRYFNPELRERFIKFVNHLKTINISFSCTDFKAIDFDYLTKDDLVYCDPPYLITCASYNEQDGWNETKEKELYELLDKIHNQGSRFALSNVFESKGKSNDILKEWSKKYNIHILNNTYANCNYRTKDKSKDSTIEVLITNY